MATDDLTYEAAVYSHNGGVMHEVHTNFRSLCKPWQYALVAIRQQRQQM
jgi:hypothetical protein